MAHLCQPLLNSYNVYVDAIVYYNMMRSFEIAMERLPVVQ